MRDLRRCHHYRGRLYHYREEVSHCLILKEINDEQGYGEEEEGADKGHDGTCRSLGYWDIVSGDKIYLGYAAASLRGRGGPEKDVAVGGLYSGLEGYGGADNPHDVIGAKPAKGTLKPRGREGDKEHEKIQAVRRYMKRAVDIMK